MAEQFKTFKMSETTIKQIDALPEKLQLKFYKAVMAYGLYDIEPSFTGLELAVWIPMRDLIDTMKKNREDYIEKQRENGRKGGRPKGSRNKANPDKPKKPKAFSKNPDELIKTQKSLNNNGNGNNNINIKENGNGNSRKTTTEKPPPFFIKTIQEEADRLGLILDSKLVSKIDLSGIDPAWLNGPFNFLQFAYEQLTTNPNYKGKRAKDYELLLAASFSWEDFRKKYPAWKQAREKTEAEREKKQAREEARKKALAKRPRTCPKCKTKLDDNLTCQTCGGYYLFEEEKLEYVFFSKPEKTLVKKFEERLQHGGNK